MIDAQKTAGRNNKTGSQKTNRLLVEQTSLLELIASGKPLEECLSALCSAIPRLNPGVRASVLLVDDQRETFKRPIAPELLPSFGEGLEGAPINNLCIGTCGEAVFSGKQVICEDIKNAEKWSEEWRELCVASDILACQSTPVFDNDGGAKASFMLCFNEARTSNEWEQRLSEFGAHIIKIALERERSNKTLLKREEELRKSREQFEMAARAGSVGTWTWDIKEDIVTTDKYLAETYGVGPEKAAMGATMKSFYEPIHEDDEEKTWNRLMKAVEETGELEAEYRVQNGDETLWILARGKVEYDKGEPVRMRGTISDITVRKRQEEKLRESEERFRLMADTVPEAIWLTDPEGRIEFFNKWWTDYCGVPYEPTTSEEVAEEFLHPEDGPKVMEAFDEAKRTGEMMEVEQRNRSAEGEYRWFLNRAMPYRDPQTGEIVQWFGVGVDIHDRKLAEQALRESEAFKDQIIDSSQDCIKVLDTDGRLLWVSDSAKQAFDCNDIACLIGETWTELWPEDSRNAVAAAITSAANGTKSHFSGWCTTMKGENKYWDVIVAPIADENGETERILAVSRDITRRKQAEEKLRESEERFRAFVEASSDAVYRMSPDWKEMYHLDGRDFIADTPKTSSTWLDEYIHPGDQERVQKAINKAISTKSIFDLEHRVLQVDGTLGWTHSRAIPILNDEGELIEWFGTARDVTEHKKIEEALKASEEKYRTLFDSMDEGYCIIEMIFDDNDKPVDYRFVEVNDAFEQQSGMSNVTGKHMLEFVSDIEEHWLENYGQVALTGQSIRFADEYKSLNRWFDVYAFRAEGWDGNKVAVLFTDVSEEKQAEQALRESKEHLELAIEVALVGTWNYDIETDLVHLDERMREIWGITKTTVPLPEVVERIHPDDREQVAAAITAALDPSSDGTYDIDYRIIWDDSTICWVSANGQVQFSREEREPVGFFGTALDVTERKQAEKKAKFRSALADALRPLLEPAEIKAEATRILCEYLDADRSLYAEVEADGEHAVIERDYTKGIPSMAGRIRLNAFGPALIDEMRRGDIHIQTNIQANPDLTEQEKKSYQAVGIQAQVGVPFMKTGQLLSILGVHQSEPRKWTDDEIALMEETAERTWAAVERARAESDLQRSEARLRTVLEGSEVGTWDLNLEDNTAWRSVEHDQIFGYDTMLPEWTYEKFMEHVLPEDREMVDQKFKDALEENGRWDFECRIIRKEGEKRWIWARGQVHHEDENSPKRMLGTVQDITEQKEAETQATFRAKLSDTLRPLADPEVIKNKATRILGEHLGVNRALYADVEEDEMYLSVQQNYVDGVSPVIGRFRLNDFGRELMDDIRAGITLTVSDVNDFDAEPRLQEAERGAYDAVGVQAFAAVPLIKNGKLVAYLGFHQSEPRKWTNDEIALMEETAERTWDAVERARVEQAVQRSEYRYRTLFESIDEGYCILEVAFDEKDKPVNYKVVEANPAAKSLIGAMKVEGKSAQEILPEEENFSFETFGNVVLTREPVHFERYAHSLGRYFSVSVYPYGQLEERKAAVLFNDITARKHSEQAIRRSNERLKAVLRGSEVGAWDFNAESGTSWQSPEYDRIFGYEPQQPEWSFEKFMDHVLPDDRERVDREYSEALSNEKLLDLEFRIRRADGEKRWIWSHGQVIRDNDTGSPKRVIGTVQDITKRKREEMQAEFRATLTDALQPLSDPVAVQSKAAKLLGEHLKANRALYVEITSDGEYGIIKRDYTSGVPSFAGKHRLKDFGPAIVKTLRENHTLIITDAHTDSRITKKERELYEASFYNSAVAVPLVKNGQLVAMFGVHQSDARIWSSDEVALIEDVAERTWDAVERARINRDLQEMNETLEERVEKRTSTLLSYQEQLRNLATRLSRAEEEERRRLAAELHDNLGQMLAVTKIKIDLMEKTGNISAIGEASDLVDDALVYTRELMSDLKPPPSLGEEGIGENLEWLAKKMNKHGLDVTFKNGNSDKPLDEEVQTTLVQSVRELLFNVIKHANTDEAKVTLSYLNHSIKIAIEDEGNGFDTENTEPDLSKGSGFGLFNIQERIDLLGGRVEIDSTPGEGTKVNLLVPLDGEKSNDLPNSPKAKTKDRQPKQSKPKIKVLLVDDHEMMREGLKKIIEGENDLTVIAEAPDGEQAIKLAHETQPDVILMDINLPGMNGIDATEKIKSELPEMCIIGLSLHNDEEVVREMRNVGASAYLNKSNAFETLCATIRSEAKR